MDNTTPNNQSTSNNQAIIVGTIEDEFVFNHVIYGEAFYTCTVRVPRLSGTSDDIRIMVSERLFAKDEYSIGDMVEIKGQFRSYNSFEDGRNKLLLTVFAKDIAHFTEEESKNPNSIYINGFICKEPIYRRTPFGREITDLLVAVNRSYNKSDYIPIIAWGRNARFAKTLNVGDNIKVWGRIQSRKYQKRVFDDLKDSESIENPENSEKVVTKTAYEVSINRMELVTEDSESSENENE